MLARRTTLLHPSGARIETPLLVPSFSSKGFGLDSSGASEVGRIMATASEYLADSLLLSAYDIHYQHLDYPATAQTELCIVDSGGYETSDLQDLSATYLQPASPNEWDQEKLHAVLDRWPEHVPAIFVSFDSQKTPLPLANQLTRARQTRARYPQHLHAFLAKPETDNQRYVQIDSLKGAVGQLAGFHVLGVTEKELGSSFIDRMQHIAELRLALDDAGMTALPIHVFGSLDPISVSLYFLAGAEIFDGLTWLRYAYLDGVAMYRQNAAVRLDLLHRRDLFVTLKLMQHNLSTLGTQTNQMRKFLNDGDYKHFGSNGDVLYQAYELLRTKLRRTI
ncbi:MAG: hypothetical protein ABL961_13765 [Vicinamibacterales bacterium]